MYRLFVKRLLDIVLSAMGIVIFSPVYLLIGLMVRIQMGAPVLFSQERIGKDEKPFRLYKFRSMTNEKDAQGQYLPEEQRMTKFGKLLRSSSLDELPELWNIFKGDMSIVGPRPLLVKYLPRYNEEQHHRHDVMPGLTGWAQVNGRNALLWEDKFRLDVWYSEHVSFLLDVKVILLTVKCVLHHEGISGGSSATMEEFRGTPEEVGK